MSNALGFVALGAILADDSILIRPRRSIGDIVAQVTIEEAHHDDVQITDHPVEQGAVITDHAYELPAELTIRCAWSNSPSNANLVSGAVGAVTGTIAGLQSLVTGNSASQVRDVYDKLLKLKAARQPFTVYTGKRKYADMLIKSLSSTTDKEHESMLEVTVVLRQLILVRTSVFAVVAPASRQANAASTSPTVGMGIKALLPTSRFSAVGGGLGFQSAGGT